MIDLQVQQLKDSKSRDRFHYFSALNKAAQMMTLAGGREGRSHSHCCFAMHGGAGDLIRGLAVQQGILGDRVRSSGEEMELVVVCLPVHEHGIQGGSCALAYMHAHRQLRGGGAAHARDPGVGQGGCGRQVHRGGLVREQPGRGAALPGGAGLKLHWEGGFQGLRNQASCRARAPSPGDGQGMGGVVLLCGHKAFCHARPAQGKFAEAEPLQRQAVELSEEIMGKVGRCNSVQGRAGQNGGEGAGAGVNGGDPLPWSLCLSLLPAKATHLLGRASGARACHIQQHLRHVAVQDAVRMLQFRMRSGCNSG